MTEALSTMDDVPQAQDSEHEVLGLVIWDATSLKRARSMLSKDDFYNPILADIWAKICEMDDKRLPVTPTTLMLQFNQRGGAFTDKMLRISTDRMGDARGLDYHCGKIEEATIARDLQVTLVRAHQRATEDWRAGDLGRGATVVADETVETLRVIQGMRRGEALGDESDMLDVVERVISDDDWIVPDVLARGERIIITAAEGWGKSTLIRQLAACIAAGLHPFDIAAIEPKRVLVVDAENPASINTMEWRRLFNSLRSLGANGRIPERGMMTLKEIGPCNLNDPREASKLYDAIDRARPDVIFIGPLYQLFEGNPNDEEPAKAAARVLDRARLMFNSALVVEAHTPHTDAMPILRPYGASLWKRWPEFGYCLHDDGSTKGKTGRALHEAMLMRESDFTAWRGSRAMGRRWPWHLSAGQRLPWETVQQPFRVQEPPQELDEPPAPLPPPPDLFDEQSA